MAVADLIPLFESIHGAVGDVVLKQYGKKVVISRRPVFRNRRFSEAQKACQARFREAALFAARLMDDPRALEIYRVMARGKGKPIRSLMIADFLHARLPEAVTSGRAMEGRAVDCVFRAEQSETPEWNTPHQGQEGTARQLPLDQLFPILIKGSFTAGIRSPVKLHSWLASILRICPGKSGTWSPLAGGSIISDQVERYDSS